ncbi:MAG: hypothetical protein JW866_01395 [Ignavibacteriales bacterium]|nr:hypothetical protein [Ignavibacteriales bacterium]
MRRKTPIEFFNVSFLDVITSTGGVFIFLVIIFLGALFFNTVLDANNKLSILWSKNLAYQDSIDSIEKDIYNENIKIDSISSLNENLNSKLGIYYNNLQILGSRNKLDSLRKTISVKKDSIILLKSISVNIYDKLEGLTSKTPQSNKLSFLKPSFDLDTTYLHWDLIVLITNDSLYLMRYTLDFTYFDWWSTDNKETKVGRPKKGDGISISKATENNSNFVKQLNSLEPNKVVFVLLYEESINSYPIVRDYIIKSKKRLSLKFGIGNPEIRFRNDGWCPNPIY